MTGKLKKLQNKFPSKVGAILVSSEVNQYYLSGFAYTDGYLLIMPKSAYLICDFRYYEAAKMLAPEGFRIVKSERKMSGTIKKILSDHRIKRVGFEDGRLSCGDLEMMKKALEDVTFIPVGDCIEALRRCKDQDEINNIISAQRIAEKALEHICGFITPDKTEKEIALELEFFMRKNGADAVSFDIIAVSGTASSLPHGVPRDVKLEKGFLTLDFGAKFGGYCSDMTRTLCIGKADVEMKKIYDTVLSAQLEAIENLKPGMTGKEADALARDIIDNAGYKECFGHSLGHGVGLEIHEAPGLSPNIRTKKLVPGNVVTVEPGIYIEGKYGVRIEDMGVITDTGFVNFTKAPKELIEI